MTPATEPSTRPNRAERRAAERGRTSTAPAAVPAPSGSSGRVHPKARGGASGVPRRTG